MLKELAELYRYRELLMNLVLRDIKVRYKNSFLGFLWSLANPLVQVATITIVFEYILKQGAAKQSYSAYLLCAFLPWTFFQMSVLDASMSILMQSPLVKKTYFPREVLPVSIVLSNLVHFVLGMLVFFAYVLIWLRAPVLVTWLLLPVLMLIQLMFNLGVALFVSALNVFFEDVKYLATVLMNLLYFALPVMYTIETVYWTDRIPSAYRPLLLKLYYLNPLAFLMTAYRKILLEPAGNDLAPDLPMDYRYLALAAVTSLVVFVAGYAFFNKRKWYFAERV